GRNREGMATFKQVAAEARALGYQPLAAVALMDLARAQSRDDDYGAAVESGKQALELAEISRMDSLAARASARLVVAAALTGRTPTGCARCGPTPPSCSRIWGGCRRRATRPRTCCASPATMAGTWTRPSPRRSPPGPRFRPARWPRAWRTPRTRWPRASSAG